MNNKLEKTRQMGQISLNPNRVEEKRKEKRISFYSEWKLFEFRRKHKN
jgi:hypothetical protein